MKKKFNAIANVLSISVLAFVASFSGTASAAALLGQAPDASLIVKAGGYEWVYANPCGGSKDSCSAVELHHNFGFATDAQWNASFASIEALMSAFQISQGVYKGLCSATYFSVSYDHCDFEDTAAGHIWGSPLATDEYSRNGFASETFLVRALDAPVDVPEPASIALLGLGLAGVAASRRKFSK